eukprot:scaffold231335_cov25-Prasinocladus_malaysianus.AAC.2
MEVKWPVCRRGMRIASASSGCLKPLEAMISLIGGQSLRGLASDQGSTVEGERLEPARLAGQSTPVWPPGFGLGE